MKERWSRYVAISSAIAVILLVAGLWGFGIHYGIDEGTATPQAAETAWGQITTGTFDLLTLPLARPLWSLGESFILLGFISVFITALLYGWLGAMTVYWARRLLNHRAV